MKSSLILCTLLVSLLSAPGLAQSYKVDGSISIGGTGGWDYLTADSANRRLYVSHAGDVVVIDLDSQKEVGKVSGMDHIHGIAIAGDVGKGFISDGGKGQVVVFGLKDLAVQTKVTAGQNPDGIVYDDISKRVFAFNGRSKDATAIDAASGSVAGTIKLDGKPEFPVSDGKGSVYVNIEDKSEIVRINATTLAVESNWPLAPCESPSGLAMDTENRRLFSVCDNKMMAIVDADSGKVIATPPVDEGPDAAGFDPGTKLAFSSNGESGTLTVIQEKDKNSYAVVQTVKTAVSARTMALDAKTHMVYLSAAKFGPPVRAAGQGRARPSVLPGTFHLIVVSK